MEAKSWNFKEVGSELRRLLLPLLWFIINTVMPTSQVLGGWGHPPAKSCCTNATQNDFAGYCNVKH